MSIHNIEKEIQRWCDDHGGDALDIGAGNTLKVDTIAESTSANGVSIDGVTIKDNAITATGITATSATGFRSQAGGFGFVSGFGAGGTVTQSTDKSTGVTLHKPCGTITTHDESLAAGAEATFTVSNVFVSAADVIIVNIASGGTSGSYLIAVTAVGSASFDITLSNVSAGALGEAIVINFFVLNGVTS